MILARLAASSIPQTGPATCGAICHLNAYSTLLVALATAAVAWIAIVSLLRERRREREQMAAADSRIVGLAAHLRRILAIEATAPDPETDEEGLEAADSLAAALDGIEDILNETVSLATAASLEKARAVSEANDAIHIAHTFAEIFSRLESDAIDTRPDDKPWVTPRRVMIQAKEEINRAMDALAGAVGTQFQEDIARAYKEIKKLADEEEARPS